MSSVDNQRLSDEALSEIAEAINLNVSESFAFDNAQDLLAIVTELQALRASATKVEPEWGDAKTVGNLIAQLRTLDPALPIYGAFHAEYKGKRQCFVRGLTLSRERVNGRKIEAGNEEVPYSAVMWSAPAQPSLMDRVSRETLKKLYELAVAVQIGPEPDEALELLLDKLAALSRTDGEDGKSFQDRVADAHGPLFDGDPTDLAERRDRFYEEATETAQALGMTEDDAHKLVSYTYSRPVGEPEKEIGAAALTLASLCVVGGWNMMECAEADLAQLQTPEKIAKVRAKRATRHGRGPLPGHSPSPRSEGDESNSQG